MKVVFGSGFIIGMLVLIALNQVYTRLRPRERIAQATLIFAQLIALTCASMILSFLAASANFPLIDRYLADADKTTGFTSGWPCSAG